MKDRKAHSDVQRAALQSVNDTIAHSTTLSNITRQLSADAVQIRCASRARSVSENIADSPAPPRPSLFTSLSAPTPSHDVRTLMNRYAARVVTILHVTGLTERDAGVLTLERSTSELLASELFTGLFADVSFEDIPAAHARWEATVEDAPEDSNTAQIASSWAHSQFRFNHLLVLIAR